MLHSLLLKTELAEACTKDIHYPELDATGFMCGGKQPPQGIAIAMAVCHLQARVLAQEKLFNSLSACSHTLRPKSGFTNELSSLTPTTAQSRHWWMEASSHRPENVHKGRASQSIQTSFQLTMCIISSYSLMFGPGKTASQRAAQRNGQSPTSNITSSNMLFRRSPMSKAKQGQPIRT